MRRFALQLILLAVAASAQAASFEARTPHHAVTVDLVSAAAGNVVFNVVVAEVPGGRVLASTRLSGKVDTPLESAVDRPGEHIAVSVAKVSTSVVCRVQIDQGDKTIDSMQSVWATEPVLSRFAPGAGPRRVGGEVKPPVVIHRVQPVYAGTAQKGHIEGIVIVEVIVGRDGNVNDARVIKPLPFGLSEAALEAVKKWKFRPGTLRGRPVEVIYNVTVTFPPAR